MSNLTVRKSHNIQKNIRFIRILILGVKKIVNADRGSGLGSGGEQQGECGGDQGLQMTHGDTSLVLFFEFGARARALWERVYPRIRR